MILVTGATGHLGANLVRRLLADGEDVRVLVREGSDDRAIAGLPVEEARGDVRVPVRMGQVAAGPSPVSSTSTSCGRTPSSAAIARRAASAISSGRRPSNCSHGIASTVRDMTLTR